MWQHACLLKRGRAVHCWQEFSVVSYTLLLAMIEYKTLILRGDHAAAAEILPQIPQACPRLPALYSSARKHTSDIICAGDE